MRWILFLVLFLLASSPVCAAPEVLDYGAFVRVPVMQDGRVKPLETLARVMLMRIHGESSYEGRPAAEWLALLFFRPSEAIAAPMLRINSPQAAQMLGLPVHPDHLYSFGELAAVLSDHAAFIRALSQKEKNSLTGDETEVARVYNAANDFAELIGTFSLLLPLGEVDDAIRARLHLPSGTPVTYFDLLKNRQQLADAFAEVVKRKGMATDSYTPDERSFARLTARLALQEQIDEDNRLVRIIPPSWGGEEWLTPWMVLKSSGGSPMNAGLLRDWRALAESYRAHDTVQWSAISQKLLAASLASMPPADGWRLSLEYYYHRLNLLLLAALCYGFGIALILRKRYLAAGAILLRAGLALHATAVIMRMLILMRPPVSTLYESLLFVSVVVMAASCWLGSRKQSNLLLLAGSFTALMLLLASWVFAGDGDTLGVLVAVLNTNFWLATHVVCITTGYGCALLAGAIAHLYLFRRAVLRLSEATLAPLFTLLLRAALVALLFTATGTMLGGIWADQSWGRFWGWDPKENGALLIVLWLVWLLHARIAGQLGSFGFALLMALVNVVVGLAWIGVNLLSVGLHSYGFTDTAAVGLFSFCALEAAYVMIMLLMPLFRPQGALPSS